MFFFPSLVVAEPLGLRALTRVRNIRELKLPGNGPKVVFFFSDRFHTFDLNLNNHKPALWQRP